MFTHRIWGYLTARIVLSTCVFVYNINADCVEKFKVTYFDVKCHIFNVYDKSLLVDQELPVRKILTNQKPPQIEPIKIISEESLFLCDV